MSEVILALRSPLVIIAVGVMVASAAITSIGPLRDFGTNLINDYLIVVVTVFVVWFLISIPLALFLGAVMRLNRHPLDPDYTEEED